MQNFRHIQRAFPWRALLCALALHLAARPVADAEPLPEADSSAPQISAHSDEAQPATVPISQTGMLLAGLGLFAFASLSCNTRLSSAWTRWTQAQRVTNPPVDQEAQFSLDAPRFG